MRALLQRAARGRVVVDGAVVGELDPAPGLVILLGVGPADGEAEAHLLVRLVGPSDEIRESILRTVGDRAEVSFSLDLPFVRMRKVGDLPTMVAKFTTDIPSLTAWGEPFLLGPGSIHVAHTPDERIAKRELLEAVDLYVDLASSLVR